MYPHINNVIVSAICNFSVSCFVAISVFYYHWSLLVLVQIALKLVSKDAEIREKMKVVDVPTGSDENQKEQIVGKQEQEQVDEVVKAEEGGREPADSTESAEVVSEVIIDEENLLSGEPDDMGKEVNGESNEETVVSDQVHGF